MSLQMRAPADPPERMMRRGAERTTAPPELPASLFARPRSWHERRSFHPIDRLSRELDDVCTTAVDSLEIAAILEAGGTTDSVSQDIYNCENVFELAEELYQRTPAVPAESQAVLDFERPGSLRDLSHGVLFALNGLFFAAALQVADSHRTTAALVLALVAGWVVGQSTSLLWFRIEGRKGTSAGQTVLRRCLMGILALSIGAGALAARAELPDVVTVLAIGQVVLVMGASILVLYKRELQFLLSLLPAAALTCVDFLGWWPVELSTLLYTIVASITLVVIQAAWLVRPQGRGHQRSHLQWSDLGHASQMALYGAVGALLLSYNAVSSLVGTRHEFRGFDLSVLPLVLTIGVAEWQLRSYRQLSKQVMGVLDDLARFGSITWRYLLRSFSWYWGILIITSVFFWLVMWYTHGVVPAESTLLITSYSVLGGALFLNLVVIAHARIDIALRALVVTGIVYGIMMVVPGVFLAEPIPALVRSAAYLALCSGLLLYLLFAARRLVRQALAHL